MIGWLGGRAAFVLADGEDGARTGEAIGASSPSRLGLDEERARALALAAGVGVRLGRR